MGTQYTGKLPRDALEQWLESGVDPISMGIDRRSVLLIKLPKSEDIAYIYSQNQRTGAATYRREPLEYCFLYDKRNHLICSGSYLPDVLFELEKGDYVTEDALQKTLEESVRSVVERTVNNDRGNLMVQEVTDPIITLNLEYALKYGVRENLVRHVFADRDALNISYRCPYEPEGWTEESLLEYLRDSDGYIQAQAGQYIQSHQEQILASLIENKALQAAYQELMQDTGNPIHRMKKITDALNQCDAKTVRVTVEKDGEEFTFKTEASSLKGHHDYYSTYYISARDRMKFEAKFGRSADYRAEEIVKISYGRKDIYTAELPGQEQQNSAVPTMTMGGM